MPHIHGVLWITPECLAKYGIKGNLCDNSDKALVSLVDNLITCRIQEDPKMKKVVREVQMHHHTQSCLKHNGICRYGFPKLPSIETVIAKPLSDDNTTKEEKKTLKAEAKKFLSKARDLLNDPDIDENISIEDFVKAIDPDLTSEKYMEYIKITEKGKKIFLKRDFKERYVNNYNEEMLHVWNANMDIQLAIEPYSVISYMVNYITKSENAVTAFLKEALDGTATKDANIKLNVLKTAYLTHRQIGASEAVYKVLPGMRLKDSNITCIFIATGFKNNRSVFYKKVHDNPINDLETIDKEDEDEEDDNDQSQVFDKKESVEIVGRQGKYQPATTLYDRYMARPKNLENMCLAQFASHYTYQAKPPKRITFDDNGHSNDKSKEQKIFNTDVCLPRYIHLKELGYMRLRFHPAVLRYHNSKKKESYEQHYSEMQLFTHWRDEEKELLPESEEKCLKEYNNREGEIVSNKKAMYPGEDVVDMLETNLEQLRPTDLLDTLDPQGQQEQEEDRIEGDIDDNEFESFGYTGNLNHRQQQIYDVSSRFKQIDLPSEFDLNHMARQLVPEQMEVMREVISSCKEIVKARNNPHIRCKPVRLIVHGGAGVGKSKTINALSKHAENILRQAGPTNYPSVLLCAFTARAAKLIGGTTIHSTFGFKIGTEITNLSNKKLAEMRDQFSQVKLIIIDEISLVGADLLYRIHLRLTDEIANRQCL